ncbi:MAG: VacJ family lipoprotein [Dongiaceae bacterium]
MRSSRPARRNARPPAGRRLAHDLLQPAALALLLGLGACASAPTEPGAKAAYDETNDPLEATNRAIFGANQFLDRNALKPVAEAYKENVPEEVQAGVHNALTNLNEPVTGINQVLQGNFDFAWDTTQRFVVNSTIGGLGIFDVATDWDLPHRDADFGQTLGVWGVDDGPYLMLPLLGPSNPRDAVGFVVDILLDPLTWVGTPAVTALNYARFGGTVIDQRAAHLADLDEVQKNSLDFYAALRSLYRQHRTDLVDQGRRTPGGNNDLIPADDGGDLPGADLPGSDQPGADLPGADLPGADEPATGAAAPAPPARHPPGCRRRAIEPPATPGTAPDGGVAGQPQPGVRVEFAPAEPIPTP